MKRKVDQSCRDIRRRGVAADAPSAKPLPTVELLATKKRYSGIYVLVYLTTL
jgi:hypothetical protein